MLLVTSSISYSQDVSEIFKADTIYFYGYDFSHAIVKTKHPINDYVFPWIVYISKQISPSHFESNMCMSVIHDFSFTNRVNGIFIENLVGGVENGVVKQEESGRHPLLFDNVNITSSKKERDKDVILMTIPNENIKKYLSEYDLEQKKGIGLVSFVAEINKEKESTLLQFIFFDIKTRYVYAADDVDISGAAGIGMEKHWGENFSLCVRWFLHGYKENLFLDYRKEYKRKRKRMRKLK